MAPRSSCPGGDSDSSPGRSKPPAHSKINTVIENGGRFLGANLQDLSATACLDYSSKTGAGHFPKAPKTRLHRGLPIEVQSGPDADIESMILMLLNLPSLRCPITI